MTEEGERHNGKIKGKGEGKERKEKSENSNRSEIASIIIFFSFLFFVLFRNSKSFKNNSFDYNAEKGVMTKKSGLFKKKCNRGI